MMVTVIAAVMAIVITVALATRLRDLASTAAPTGVAGAPPAAHASRTSARMECGSARAAAVGAGGRAVGAEAAVVGRGRERAGGRWR
jgi:hypothetical protein